MNPELYKTLYKISEFEHYKACGTYKPLMLTFNLILLFSFYCLI